MKGEAKFKQHRPDASVGLLFLEPLAEEITQLQVVNRVNHFHSVNNRFNQSTLLQCDQKRSIY